jgi:hypothetical protein
VHWKGGSHTPAPGGASAGAQVSCPDRRAPLQESNSAT